MVVYSLLELTAWTVILSPVETNKFSLTSFICLWVWQLKIDSFSLPNEPCSKAGHAKAGHAKAGHAKAGHAKAGHAKAGHASFYRPRKICLCVHGRQGKRDKCTRNASVMLLANKRGGLHM